MAIEMESMSVKLLAMPARMTPSKKKIRLISTMILRPKRSEKDAMVGWKTVEQSKNEVPAQNASIAVPCNFSVIRGKATKREVPSRATMSIKTAKVRNTSWPRVVR